MARLGAPFVLLDEDVAVLLSEQRNEERLAVVGEENRGTLVFEQSGSPVPFSPREKVARSAG